MVEALHGSQGSSGQSTGFTHLHLHTQYSLLDGAIRMNELAPTVKEQGMDSVAVTDHGNMFGAVHFYQQAKKHGVKPIMGCEAYVAGDKGRKDRTDRTSSHLVLLAKDNEGYKNLSYLVSMGYMEGFYYKPRIDKELLKKHSKGIIGLSACLGGVVNKKLLREGESAAAAEAKAYAELFDKDHFFLEIQSNGIETQNRCNSALMNISELTGIPLVATADSHYRTPEDSYAHEILMCIGQGMSLEEFRQKGFEHSDKLYVRNPQEMWDDFSRLAPHAVENTQRIARACNVDLDLSSVFLPQFGVPDGFTRETYLEKLAYDGLQRRIKEASYAVDVAAYKQRLEYELGVIVKMGFAGYFLIVWDFINFAKSTQIPVGPGRGSGAGSLVAWALRITDLDPIPYDLIFERFLNPERVSMPDFDIDFCMEKRGDVINYVSKKYGEQNVAQIVTYSELSAKSGIKDVGRVLGLPFGEVNQLTKLIPGLINGKKVSIDQALEVEPKLRDIQNEKPVYKDVINVGRRLEGMNRQTGMHAAGIVIGDKPIWEYVPVLRGKEGELITQFAKDEVEQAGLVKFDFLGLKTLTVLRHAVKHVRARTDAGPLGPNPEFDLEKVTLDDPKVYELIASADTDGVFQLESSGFKELLKRLQPDCFEDIVAAVALYRPGPLEAGMVDDYIDRKHGRKEVAYPHPVCEPILKATYGVIVYQEQVMRIAVDLCGFSMGQADVLRKAMGKKKADVMAEMSIKFVDGAFEHNQMPKEDGKALFDKILKFAGYAFNKSHSAAYAVISYQTAYLKTYYPVEFMAALLSTEMKTQDNVVKYIQSARERGIVVRPPDAERSDRDFSVIETAPGQRAILFGLGAVRGVGDSAIEAILASRSEHDSFGSIFGLCEKVELKKLNKKVLEALVKSGACDGYGATRAQHMAVVERALERAQRTQRDAAIGQTSMFDAFSAAATQAGDEANDSIEYPDVLPWTEKHLLAQEKDALGFYISGHPLDRYLKDIPRLTSATTQSLGTLSQGKGRFQEVTLAGVIAQYRERPLKNGSGRMAFLTLEDHHGSVEILVFSKVFQEHEEVLRTDDPILVKGALMVDGDGEESVLKVRALKIERLAEAREREAKGLRMRAEIATMNEDAWVSMKALLAENRGRVPCKVTLTKTGQYECELKLPEYLAVSLSDELLGGLERITKNPVLVE